MFSYNEFTHHFTVKRQVLFMIHTNFIINFKVLLSAVLRWTIMSIVHTLISGTYKEENNTSWDEVEGSKNVNNNLSLPSSISQGNSATQCLQNKCIDYEQSFVAILAPHILLAWNMCKITYFTTLANLNTPYFTFNPFLARFLPCQMSTAH
jgi:hypothetical protein